VLIFDQFEELLTISATDREAKRVFFAQLGKVLRSHDRWALFAMREDYIGAIAPYVRPIPGQLDNTFRLDLLRPEAAKQAIREPARKAGIDFTGDAAQKLVDDLRVIHVQNPDGTIEDQPGPFVEPVQLQVVCYRLWETLDPSSQAIDLDNIASIGDVDQSLADYYALSVTNTAKQSSVNERIIREWFENRLITKEGIRGQVLLGAEYSDGLDNRAVHLLENAHIIRGEKRAGTTWFELAHDRLIEPIRTDNRKWFSANLSLFQRQVDLWAKQGKPDGMLFRDKELDTAEDEARELVLNADEQAFLEACRKLNAQEAREKKRNRLMTLLAIVATIAMIVAGIFWGQANNAAEKNAQLASRNANIAATARADETNAKNRLLLAQTQLIDVREGKNAFARLALAIEAFNKLYDFEAYQTLWSSIYQFMPDVFYINTDGNSIITICFSPDSKLLVSGDSENRIHVWDVQTGIEYFKLNIDNSLVKVLCIPDGAKIITASSNGDISIWDLKTGNKLNMTRNNGDIVDIAISRDGKNLVSGNKDGQIRLSDSSTGQLKSIAQHENSISRVSFSPDGKQIASSSINGVVLVWDIDSNETNQLITGTSELHLTYSPDSKWIVTGGNDGSIIIWDSISLEKVKTMYQDKSITAMNFSSDGKFLISAADDDQVKIWNTESFKEMYTLNTFGAAHSVQFSPDNQYFVVGGYDCYTRVYKLGGTDRMGHLRVYGISSFPNENQINQVSFSPDGKSIASASKEGLVIVPLIRTNYFYQDSQVWNVDFNKDNNLLVTSSRDGTAKVWELKRGQEILRLTHTDWVNHAEFSPDGKFIVTASSDHTAKLWRISDRRVIFTINHNDVVSTAKFNSDGTLVASAGWDGVAQIWQVKNATKVFEILHQDSVNEVLFSPNNKWVITASNDHFVRVWDLKEHREVFDLAHNAAVTAMDITPDGDYIITGEEDGSIMGWDSQLRQLAFSTNLEMGKIQKISISSDGKLMAAGNVIGDTCVWQIAPFTKVLCFSAEKAIWDIKFSSSDFVMAASSDASVHIWDLNSLKEYGRIIEFGPVLSLDLSSDNHYLAVSTSAGVSNLVIWKREDVISEACKRLPRQLAKDEWGKYFDGVEYKPFCIVYISENK
jgi:WD40 repeat protein